GKQSAALRVLLSQYFTHAGSDYGGGYLPFQEVAFFFDDNDCFQAFRKTPKECGFAGAQQAHFRKPNAVRAQRGIVVAEIFECLQGVGPAFAGTDQTDAVAGAGAYNAIQFVGLCVGQYSGMPLVVQFALCLDISYRKEAMIGHPYKG